MTTARCAFAALNQRFGAGVVALTLMGLAGSQSHAQPQVPAQGPQPIGAEVFFKTPDIAHAVLSPSGKRLAVTSGSGVERLGLVVFDLEAGNKPTRVAQMAAGDVVDAAWVNDDMLVFRVLDLGKGSGSEVNRTSETDLFMARADGSGVRRLIDGRDARTREALVTVRKPLTYNHTLLHIPAAQPGSPNEEVIVGEWVFEGGSARFDSRKPIRLNVRTGLTGEMDLNAPAHTQQWIFDSKGQARVAITQFEGNTGIHWRAPGQNSWKQLVQSKSLDVPFWPVAVDDTGGLVVTRSQGAGGHAVLTRYDFEKNAPSQATWAQVPGFDFRGHVVAENPGGAALGVQIHADAETTVWLHPALQRVQKLADERWPGRVNRLSCRRCGESDMVVLVRSMADTDPGRFWVFRQATGQWTSVGPVMNGIDPARMASVDFQRIKARDGRDLPVWLTLPAGHKANRTAAAVVLVHGGPWVRDGFWRWNALEQFLASRGYVVISPEFRGSTGYGQAHFRAGFKQWGQAMQDDVADALLWAQAQGIVDQRACIVGGSYGGYATLMGLVRHPELYRCGVAYAAVSDMALFLDGSFWVNDDITAESRLYGYRATIGDSKEDADMLKRVSPVEQAAHIKAPVMLVHGDSDWRVPINHARRMRTALQAAGNEPEWVSYTDEGHYWRQFSTRVDFAQRVERFLGQHLKQPAATTAK